jgi:hypothetical protein
VASGALRRANGAEIWAETMAPTGGSIAQSNRERRSATRSLTVLLGRRPSAQGEKGKGERAIGRAGLRLGLGQKESDQQAGLAEGKSWAGLVRLGQSGQKEGKEPREEGNPFHFSKLTFQ